MRSQLLAAAMLAASFAAPVAATDHLPFKGSLAGTATVVPINPPIVQVTIHATGTATQLGRFTLVAPHTVNQATLTAVGTYSFTAANGDTITATLEGTAQMIDPPNVIATSETGVITGGTGRFAGATGTFHVDRIFNRATGVTTGSFEGWISVPGA